MRLILGAPLVLLLGATLWVVAWWRGYRAGFAHAERAAAGSIGRQLASWDSPRYAVNRAVDTLDLTGVKDRAK